MLDEVDLTGRVPLYVNLKEWSRSKQWTRESPPTTEDLFVFIRDYLTSSLDVFAQEFLRAYYSRMFEHGRFFLLLDSFDEIPAVLDAEESSWILEGLSAIISATLSGDTRGVVASRQFRRPRLATYSNTTFTIRPFSDLQIAHMLRKSFLFREGTLQVLFRERPELVSIVRNPLAAELLRVYLDEHEGRLPENQLALYEAYIALRLSASLRKPSTAGLSMAEIYRVGQEMAWLMFQSPGVGLEASVTELASQLGHLQIREVTSTLTAARLARVGGVGGQHFSFVHRRFFEYFLARFFITHPDLIDVSDIRRDSRARDALVLFCEVANKDVAVAIANTCWTQISTAMVANRAHEKVGSSEYLEAVHCLRFLCDAFRTRPNCLDAFRDELAAYADLAIREGMNLLETKHALEATGLLKSEDVERCVTSALSLGADWISETALRACRHLPRLGSRLTGHVGVYLGDLSSITLLRTRKELLFALGLSEAFGGLKRYCRVRILEASTVCLAAMALLVIQPLLAVFLLGVLSAFHIAARLRKASGRTLTEVTIKNGRMAAAVCLGLTVWPLWAAGFGLFSPATTIDQAGTAVDQVASEKVAGNTQEAAGAKSSMMEAKGRSEFAATLFSLLRNVARGAGAVAILYSTPFMLFGSAGLRFLCGIDLIIGVLLFPWLGFYDMKFEFQRRTDSERSVGCVGLSLVFVSLGLGVLSLFADEAEAPSRAKAAGFPKEARIVFTLAALTVMIFLLRAVSRVVHGCFTDWRLGLEVRRGLSLDRESIEETFYSFRTSWGRERYVEWLGQLPARPRGAWVKGLPNLENDLASQRLAQLEEQWLGLAQ